MGLLAHEHRPGFGERLEPRGGVDRVAERRVLDAAPGAERPDDDRSGVDTDPDAEPLVTERALDLARVPRDLVDHPERGAHGAFGIVLVGGRRAEQREHAVARQVLHGAAERLHRTDHARDRVVDDELGVLGAEAFGQRRSSPRGRRTSP